MWSSDLWWYGCYGISFVFVGWMLEYAIIQMLDNYYKHLPVIDQDTKRYLIKAGFYFTFGILGYVFVYFMSLDERKTSK